MMDTRISMEVGLLDMALQFYCFFIECNHVFTRYWNHSRYWELKNYHRNPRNWIGTWGISLSSSPWTLHYRWRNKYSPSPPYHRGSTNAFLIPELDRTGNIPKAPWGKRSGRQNSTKYPMTRNRIHTSSNRAPRWQTPLKCSRNWKEDGSENHRRSQGVYRLLFTWIKQNKEYYRRKSRPIKYKTHIFPCTNGIWKGSRWGSGPHARYLDEPRSKNHRSYQTTLEIMNQYKVAFDAYMWIKDAPNEHEKILFQRVEKYIPPLGKIPWIKMIAVCNSLSMYATTKESDIDLFIITEPRMIWFVRFFVTFSLWIQWVWRHGEDIAGNFCLSFFITTEAQNLQEIAIENDIYLYYWMYYMKPLIAYWSTYEDFLEANTWVTLDASQKKQNLLFLNPIHTFRKITAVHRFLDSCIKFFLKRKTLRSYKKLYSSEGIIISESILKFHLHDRRKEIRDAILEKNFDKS